MAVAEQPPVHQTGGPPVGVDQNPRSDRGKNRRWALVAVGVVGLVVGIGLGAAAGAVQTKTIESTKTIVSVQTHRVPVVHFRTRVVNHTHTVTNTITRAVTAAAPATSPPSSSGAPSGAPVYTGNGDKSFGTLAVSQDSTLHWTCQCDPANGFYLSSDLNADVNSIDIQQSGSSGTSAVTAGSYPNVHSIGNGQFSFYLSPG